MWFDPFTIAPMLFAMLIPIAFCLKCKNENLKKIVILSVFLVLVVLLYPLVDYFSEIADDAGYFVGKSILFTIIPLIAIVYLEKSKTKEILIQLGVRKENLLTSVLLGLGALIITLFIVLSITWGNEGITSLSWNIIMFFEAFNEEFLFRGVLLLYLLSITDIRVAYITSVLAFLLAHPQHFNSTFIIPTALQGILLGLVAYKTKNIIGAWISHGLNRTLIQALRIVLF